MRKNPGRREIRGQTLFSVTQENLGLAPNFPPPPNSVRNFRLRLPFRCALRTRIGMAVPLRAVLAWWMMRDFRALLLVPAKDHLSRRRLEHAGDRRFDSLADHLPR